MEAQDAKETAQRHEYLKDKEAIIDGASYTVARLDSIESKQGNEFEVFVYFNERNRLTPERISLDNFFKLPDVLEFYYAAHHRPGDKGWKVGATNSLAEIPAANTIKVYEYDSIEKAIYHFNHFKTDKHLEAKTEEPSNDERFVYIFKEN